MRIEASQIEAAVSGLDEPMGLVMGRSLGGDRVLQPLGGGRGLWPFSELSAPALLLGASNAGKTETIKRFLYEVATKTDWPISLMDAKGDERLAEWFFDLARDTNRGPRLFPNEPFDGWRGDWKAIVNRLMQVIAYSETGDGAFYRYVAMTILQTVCGDADDPPRSGQELLTRLSNASRSTAFTDELVTGVELRYKSFFRQIGTALDGDWAWEDTDAAYFMVGSLGAEQYSAAAAAYLFADFGHYFTKRKPRDQRCALAVDEFAAIARTSDVAMLVEQARGFGAFLLLAPQTISGLGSPEQQSRIIGSVDMLICHRTKEPGRIAELTGEREVAKVNQAYEDGQRTGRGHVQVESDIRLRPAQLQGLRAGEAWFIRNSEAQKVAVDAVDALKGPVELPAEQDLEYPVEEKEVDDADAERLPGEPMEGRER